MVLSYKDLMIVIWTLWGAALVFTVLRAVSRWWSQKKFFADDYFVFAGFCTLTALSVVIQQLLPQFYLAGEYTKAAITNPLTPLPLPLDEFTAATVRSLKLMFCQMLLFWTTLWTAKFSLLFFFRRLVIGLPRYMKVWWGVFSVVLVLYLACMLSNFTTCAPLQKYWSATGCSAPNDLKRADASIKFATSADVVADALIMLLPLNLLRRLKISPQQKFGLATIFCLGGIIIAFALARVAQVTKATSVVKEDPTTLINGPVLLSMWSHIESSVSVIVASLPAFRFLLNRRAGVTHGPSGGYVAGSGGNTKGSKNNTIGGGHGPSMRLGSMSKDKQSLGSVDEFGSSEELHAMNEGGGIKKQMSIKQEVWTRSHGHDNNV